MDPLVWVVLLCTGLSGFFALTGYSLRAFRRSRLEEVLEDHPGKARLEVLDRHLWALRLNASLCRTISNVMLVVVVSMLFGGRILPTVGVSIGLIALFGIAIPHAWAAYADEQILAATFPVLLVLRRVMSPAIWLMQRFDLPIRRLTGIAETEASTEETAKQDILQAASDGQAEGAVDADEVEMIESVMEFGDTHAAEIMTPRTDIFALDSGMTWKDAVQRIIEAGHTRVPVFSGDIDNIIGVLYAKDMLRLIGAGESIAIEDLVRKPFFVPETKALDDLLKEFKVRMVHIAIVLDEYGGTAGMVTIEDVLEEIVGEIADEYDQSEEDMMQRIDDRTIEADGRMYIDDLNDALDLEIPEDAGYDTVAGLVFSELGYIPQVDETLQAFGADFAVLAADDRKITRLRVKAAGSKG
ncbi:MAG: hemolysin family protein [Phycisphaerae bacterium]|nr:hemolysin family protein [Phycisphaerae bacterium]